MRHKPFSAELQSDARAARTAADSGPRSGPGPGFGPGPGPADDRIGAILDGIARLEQRLDGLPAGGAAAGGGNGSYADMDARVEETRRQIAGITAATAGGVDRITAAGCELDAIVAATEAATQTILAAAEDIERVVEDVTATAGSPIVGQQLGEATDAVTRILQASTFQDITGQRIAKVVATLGFVEERVRALAALWDAPDAPAPAAAAAPDAAAPEEEDLLEGPQLDNRGITQAEIDALFD
jgi:chemotaxis protein CheZ